MNGMKRTICIFFISTAAVYALLRLVLIVLSFIGFVLVSPSNGKEFIFGTILPDFLFLFIFWFFSYIYFTNKTVTTIITNVIFVLLVLTIIPRLLLGHEYYVIEGEGGKGDYVIRFESYKIAGEAYDGYTFYTYKEVSPFVYQPRDVYTYTNNLNSDVLSDLYRKRYTVIDGNVLILGDFKIHLK